ncbi:uncharacterized protein B0T15DRAFT_285848 [Chaetomium strumarium]|uniref:Uncharacterized protein n=1 Tax=Chaetomium strumarium TaxID=1170767 RepID=A0AAJ0GQ45_9PEZI|nr:hypothetical protein B0T15DRAFT_285848 [Chaetomium strumarium]
MQPGSCPIRRIFLTSGVFAANPSTAHCPSRSSTRQTNSSKHTTQLRDFKSARCQTTSQSARCVSTKNNLHEMFPDLEVLPRPEPNYASKEEHISWQQEYEQWRGLRCGCGRGYFCREHGSWISGLEVGSKVAVTWEQQQRGLCPNTTTKFRQWDNATPWLGCLFPSQVTRTSPLTSVSATASHPRALKIEI